MPDNYIMKIQGQEELHSGIYYEVDFSLPPIGEGGMGRVYKGFQVPHWAEARNLALSLALEEPKARFVGWDVVMTDYGFDILEGNIPPAEELTELNLKGK